LPLDGPAVLATALAYDAPTLDRRLDCVVASADKLPRAIPSGNPTEASSVS